MGLAENKYLTYKLSKFLLLKFNCFVLKHVHHQEKNFLTENGSMQNKCNKCINIKAAMHEKLFSYQYVCIYLPTKW